MDGILAIGFNRQEGAQVAGLLAARLPGGRQQAEDEAV